MGMDGSKQGLESRSTLFQRLLAISGNHREMHHIQTFVSISSCLSHILQIQNPDNCTGMSKYLTMILHHNNKFVDSKIHTVYMLFHTCMYASTTLYTNGVCPLCKMFSPLRP